MKLLICGYIRPEKNYDSLRKLSFNILLIISYVHLGYLKFAESLIDDINLDIEQASTSLDETQFKEFAEDDCFTTKNQNHHL